ncbi:DNA-formamidopyrimidine glycosylase [Loigolactobacillus backii]|uniref:Formamidopyrimidine-DNA glycosylase n=1 Tax=Loigolactobacillus backii TaxID=375175 RepID=A0A192H2W8_9LACO|nr:DNA-formamidopyrimidine glycosylase [Loigolactobacillus backii]ANK59297.1 DNA-formamidopyrimidine glycosylase [Loigolactobacillus backii]ANK62710.1 DNA-formamidopyrimidine glycosylase [Loigolactobacillus backii]ANK64289.1 DNA-formamidopyrimidine glycosylase [Loigolactobacillus backii]ANK67317.1 DNA-formamidopyrimidine glycosylase [Loigolactobacillus backii]ANK70282.1 DNA-formamidopyrimidine glycosylase [Loigolactobacillus backii]
MPELPEVETVRQGLRELILNKTIDQVQVLWPKIVNGDTEQFRQTLQGLTFIEIDRRGKYLLFRLSEQMTMVSHLRMEGKYRLNKQDDPVTKHTHVIFNFTDGTALRYLDVRKFGRMTLIKTGQEMTLPGLNKLGAEPTAQTFKIADFTKGLKRHKKAIKPTLLDQQVVAGLGNIYADEVLWLSGINPLQPANTLTDQQVKLLHDNIIAEMKQAIKAKGTTIRSYTDAYGATGGFQLSLHVYGREGEACERCGGTIEKTRLAQRGTHFCPHCQVLNVPTK